MNISETEVKSTDSGMKSLENNQKNIENSLCLDSQLIHSSYASNTQPLAQSGTEKETIDLIPISVIPRSLSLRLSNSIEYYEPLLTQRIDEISTRSFLSHNRWPKGFQEEYLASCKEFAMRFVLIDNSGSMTVGDCHKVVGKGKKSKLVHCTRWVELLDFLNFQARLANVAKTPTEYRFLQQSQNTVIGVSDDHGKGLQQTLKLLGETPSGTASLCEKITELVHTVKTLEPILRQNNQKVCVLIATDGDSSDGDLIEAMRPLQYLPVWLIFNLFTSDSKTIEFWHNIDIQLELDIDVISDIVTEANQVKECNPWLTYGSTIHQLRLIGAAGKEFDLLDERSLSKQQIEKVLKIILPEEFFDGLKKPITEDFSGFVDALDNYFKVQLKPSSSPNHLSDFNKPSSFHETIARIPLSPKGSKGSCSPSDSGSDSNLLVNYLTTWDPLSASLKPWVDITMLAESFELIRTPKSSSCTIT